MYIWNYYNYPLSTKGLVKQAKLVYSLTWVFTKKKNPSTLEVASNGNRLNQFSS